MFSDGRLIGGMGIGSLPGYCEFGYWLAHSAWGKGFATEAGRAVLAYGFDVLGLRLVRSGVFAARLRRIKHWQSQWHPSGWMTREFKITKIS